MGPLPSLHPRATAQLTHGLIRPWLPYYRKLKGCFKDEKSTNFKVITYSIRIIKIQCIYGKHVLI
jgi:hypothetical protein